MSKGLERSIARGGLFDMTVGVKTETGKTAPDGRPIFREVFLLGDTAAGVDQALSPDGVIDQIITAYGATKSIANLQYAIPYVGEDDTLNIGINANAAGDTVNVVAGTVAELQGGWVVVEYVE